MSWPKSITTSYGEMRYLQACRSLGIVPDSIRGSTERGGNYLRNSTCARRALVAQVMREHDSSGLWCSYPEIAAAMSIKSHSSIVYMVKGRPDRKEVR